MPIIPIAVWSLAPALSLFGVLRILGRKRVFPVVLMALLVEATAIISFVAGPMFLLYVFVPLAVTTLLASIAAAPRLRHPARGFLQDRTGEQRRRRGCRKDGEACSLNNFLVPGMRGVRGRS